MPIPFTLVAVRDDQGHEYRDHAPDGNPTWMESVASEYVSLRTATATSLADVALDGIDVVDVAALRRRLHQASVPQRRGGRFDVMRSDFGEVLSYALLEQEYGTSIGYKSIRDRELASSPGRGIDAIGVENDGITPDGMEKLRLVLMETKVSDEQRCPPQVVDQSEDSLRNQHIAHVSDFSVTVSKVFQQARHMVDARERNRLFRAALLTEAMQWDRVTIVACSVLVRSQERCQAGDCGSFGANPMDFAPAQVRFLIVQLPASVEQTVDAWSTIVAAMDVAA